MTAMTRDAIKIESLKKEIRNSRLTVVFAQHAYKPKTRRILHFVFYVSAPAHSYIRNLRKYFHGYAFRPHVTE